jgi:hypothetical protein
VADDTSLASSKTLALVAAARCAVGAAMILAPGRFFRPDSGTETLLMRTIGIRDLVLGSGACVAWASGSHKEFRRWATVGLLSDSADIVTGISSRTSLGARSTAIAALSPVPFVAAGIAGLVRGRD